MVYHHSLAGKIIVPFGLFSVFDHKSLVVCQRNVVCNGGIERIDCRKVNVFSCCGKGVKVKPICNPPFHCRQSHRCCTIVHVRAACHQIPIARCVGISARTIIIGVVKVRKSQHMTKLVAYCSDSVHCNGVSLLCRARVGTETHPVFDYAVSDIASMRPNLVYISRRRLGSACKNDMNGIDPVIAVVVVVGIVHIGICGVDCVRNKVSYVCIVIASLIAAIV